MKPSIEQRAKTFYNIYGASAKNLNYQGKPMPLWDDLPQAIRDHWMAVAEFTLIEDNTETIQTYMWEKVFPRMKAAKKAVLEADKKVLLEDDKYGRAMNVAFTNFETCLLWLELACESQLERLLKSQ